VIYLTVSVRSVLPVDTVSVLSSIHVRRKFDTNVISWTSIFVVRIMDNFYSRFYS
jgi:hypothetical protein